MASGDNQQLIRFASVAQLVEHWFCKPDVVGSSPSASFVELQQGEVCQSSSVCVVGENWGVFQSGQMGQTVNLVAYAFAGSNPAAPTLVFCEEFC